MNKEIYSFYELVEQYEVNIPILQRDYAQGLEINLPICKNFLNELKLSIIERKQINLDFIYGNLNNDVFLPLDGQQRLTTLFLLHWYACEKEQCDESCFSTLKRFSYETRFSSRNFCESLLENSVSIENDASKISEQILDSKWFYLSWKHDPTIRAMLNTIDLIHSIFMDVDNLWSALVEQKTIVFHLLILENFGLSDDLYIKMNARGRLLTTFENLKAEIQDKAIKEKWEAEKAELDKFSYKIDGDWTDFLWQHFNKDNTIDNAHMNLITTLVMTKLPTNQLLKAQERIDVIQKLNASNNVRELIDYIDKETFDYITDVYTLYYGLICNNSLPSLDLVLWNHKPEGSLLHQVLLGVETSYSRKVLFYAQTRYLLSNPIVNTERFAEWIRVIRNIVARADLTPDGVRSDFIRSPEAFNGVIGLVNELATGCSDIYSFLSSSSISSNYAVDQVKEEILKAKIIQTYPEHKTLIFSIEDNELLRGRITKAIEYAGYRCDINEIDFELLEKIQVVFKRYFNMDLDQDGSQFDKFRRAMLTIEVDNQYRYYDYWQSEWNALDQKMIKKKLFPNFREIEYMLESKRVDPKEKEYFKKMVLMLTQEDYDTIINNFEKPDLMEYWQYRLIKEEGLLASCKSKHFAIAPDRSYCYLLKGKRPPNANGCRKIE